MIRWAVLLAAIATVSPARADVISGSPPAPPRCALGAVPSRPMRGHGFYCAAAPACTTDADCTGGGGCQDTAICILAGSDTAPYECQADGSCFSGECSRARRCVPPPIGSTPPPAPPVAAAPPASPSPPAASSPSAGCNAQSGDGGASSLIGLAIVLGLVRGARRHGRERGRETGRGPE